MIGTKLSNRFEILRELGRGGMGVVYLAWDPILEREIAVKVVSPAALNPATAERFRREARVVARMDHPAIVGLYDIGEHEGSLYIVMPFVPGTNLRSYIKDRSLRIKDVVDVGIQVAEALEYSHLRGVVHRDIKPENIMVSQEIAADQLRVRLTDFGLAVPTAENRLTQSGAIVGTVGYISPEQLSQGELDGRSDVYSLGTVLFECVVGETPFSGDMLTVLYRIAHENPQPPRSWGVELPEELEAVILRCLEKAPARRPQRAGELAEELASLRSRLHQDEASRLALDATSPTIQIHHRPAGSPLIGRQEEFAELQNRLNAAASGECQFAVIGGEAGIGKSRLLEEIEKAAAVRKFRVLHGRFAEQHHTFPYQGFCDLISDYLRSKAGTFPESGSSADLSDLASDLVSLFPMLVEFERIGSAAKDSRIPSFPGELKKFDDRTYVFELLAKTLNRISASKPLVILLEELHTADASVQALQYVVHRLISAPVLIVATFRTTEVDKSHPLIKMLDALQGDRRFALILLQPFSPSQHREFVEAIGGSKVEEGLAERLFAATDGNPYFTRELFRSLLDSKGITKTQSGPLKLSGHDLISSQPLPATIQQTVQKRVDRLPKDLRQILSIASVLGKAFAFRDLELLAEKDMEDAVDRLVEEGFIEEERESRGDRFTFSSGMLRDVLYAAFPPRKRRSLHRKYAQELEQRNAERLDRIYPELVHHYSNGDVAEKVIEYGLRLARKSLAAFSPENAARAAKAVLDFLEEGANPLLEAEVRTLLARAYRMSGNVDASLEELEEVIQILESKEDPSQAVKTMLEAVETAWEGRKFDHTRNLVEKGIPSARRVGDPGSLSKFLSIAASMASLAGEHEKAKTYAEDLEVLQPQADVREDKILRGGRLVVALSAPVQAQHPADIRVAEEYEIFANVFETLLKTDTKGNPVPFLCERWELLDQGRSFLMAMRPDVRLQDSRILTARLVKESLENAIQRSGRHTMPAALAAIRGVQEYLAGSAQTVAGLVVFSDQKLGIELSERLPLYPAMLSDMRTAVARETAEGKVVGTGPFQIVSLSAHHAILERNPVYWRSGLPLLDILEFRTSMTSKEIAEGYRSGLFDVVRDLQPEELELILQDRSLGASLVEAPEKNVYIVLFNTSGPAAKNSTLCRALCGVVRTHDLVRKTLGRSAQPAEGVLPPGILGHDPGRRRHTLTHEKCAELIQSSGLSLPIRLRAAVHPIFQDRYASLTESLFEVWSELGVEVSIETTTMASFLDCKQKNEDIDLIMTRWIADYDDPDNFTYGLLHSRMGHLRKYYSSKELDQLTEAARVESKSSAREELYLKIEDFLMDTGLLLPLFHDIDYRVAGSRVKGMSLQSSPPYVNYAELGKMEVAATATVPKGTGGIITVPVARELLDLDPSLGLLAVSLETIPNIFETLTRHRVGAQTVPWLASEVSAEQGGRRYRFRLREDVRFHDSRKLTARDVRYSFERLLANPESKCRWMLLPIRGAKAVVDGSADTLEGFHFLSSSEFTIDLDQPLSFFPALLTYPGASIVPEGIDQFRSSWRQGCVGTGPFRVLRFDRGLLELEANPYYWRSGFPRCDRLIFTFGVTPPDVISGFKAGRFSLASDMTPSDVQVLRLDPAFGSKYHESPCLSTEYVVFNIHQGPLRDEQLRHHLVRALDVETIVQQNLGRVGIAAHGLIPPGMLGHEAAVQRSAPSRKKWFQNVELVAAISPRHQGRYSALARNIFTALEEAGVRIRILNPSESEYAQMLTSPSVDLTVTGWGADYPDADTFAHGVLHSEQGADGRFCGTPEIDRLIEKGRTETDPAGRRQIYRDIEVILSSQALLLPLFHEQTFRFARPEVEGLEISLFFPKVDYQSLWIRW